jgi:hypothetical protein
MKPLAAIWHFADAPNGGKNAGDFAVAILSVFLIPGQAFGFGYQAIVVDSARRLRNVQVAELEVIGQDAMDALAEAQRHLTIT